MLFGALWLILFMATQHANCNTNNSNNGGTNRDQEQRQIGRLLANQGQVFGLSHLSVEQRVAVRAINGSNCMSICSSPPAPAGNVGRTMWSLRTYVRMHVCVWLLFICKCKHFYACRCHKGNKCNNGNGRIKYQK